MRVFETSLGSGRSFTDLSEVGTLTNSLIIDKVLCLSCEPVSIRTLICESIHSLARYGSFHEEMKPIKNEVRSYL